MGNLEYLGTLLTSHQARGKWMIPAYKAVLYTSFGASMYMMGRLVLVSVHGKDGGLDD